MNKRTVNALSFPKNEQTDALTRAILSLESVEECYAFFEDVCTIKEILSMAQRLRVAELLSEGNSYQSVCEKTGASSATVGRVKRCLDYGSGGYKMIIERQKGSEE